MTLIDQLHLAKNLTATEQRLRDYMLNHLEAMPTITIETLAQATFASHSAIVRLGLCVKWC